MAESPDILAGLMQQVAARTGVDMGGRLTGRLQSHVTEQMRRHGLTGPGELLRRADLLDELLASVLVHETFFYRFHSQLDALESRLLPEILEASGAGLAVWSAGCSNGPEPYTLAMIATRAAERTGRNVPVEVLGTDLCGAFVDEAQRGIYRAEKLGSLPPELRERYLASRPDGTYEVREELRRKVSFERHNLLEPPPRRGFQLVSCRNVLMYMRSAERRRAIGHLASALSPDGFLITGHSETLRDVPDILTPDRRFAVGIYRPAGAAGAAEPATAALPDRPAPAEPGPDAIATDEPAGPLRVLLEGEYDADLDPDKIESLKRLLARAIDGERDAVLEADGATHLDRSTGKLVARAARVVSSHGQRLTVRASRPAVIRWARRNGLDVEEVEP